VDISGVVVIFIFDVGIFKIPQIDIGVRDKEIGQIKRQCCKHCGGNHVRPEHSGKTDAVAQNGDDFRMGSHFGSEIYDRDKGEQGTEKVDEVGDEIKVIIKNNFVERCFAGNQVINVFGDVENYYNNDY